ncbi:hypothetical protein ABBQ38_007036 [Trebouxia sp. C0009 RCD-2024]
MSIRALQLRIGRTAPVRHYEQLRSRCLTVRCYNSGFRSRDARERFPRERPDGTKRFESRESNSSNWQQHDRGNPDQLQWRQPYEGDRRQPGREQRSSWQQERADGAERPVTTTSILQDNWKGDAVYGVSPVLAALKFSRRTLYSLHVQEGLKPAKKKDQTAVARAVQAAKAAGADVCSTSKHDLNIISGNRPHQGLVLDCSPLSFVPIDRLEDANQSPGDLTKPPLWLVLDEVMDPQNFGAALRSAHFLGASGVLTCHRNSAPLSPVVSKASAGAMEAMPVHSAQNLPRTLAAAAAAGWQVIGATSDPTSMNCLDVSMTQPTLLVLGNEGVGLRTTVRNVCQALVKIDTGHVTDPDSVDSLNVSVATGILLHQLLTSRNKQ